MGDKMLPNNDVKFTHSRYLQQQIRVGIKFGSEGAEYSNTPAMAAHTEKLQNKPITVLTFETEEEAMERWRWLESEKHPAIVGTEYIQHKDPKTNTPIKSFAVTRVQFTLADVVQNLDLFWLYSQNQITGITTAFQKLICDMIDVFDYMRAKGCGIKTTSILDHIGIAENLGNPKVLQHEKERNSPWQTLRTLLDKIKSEQNIVAPPPQFDSFFGVLLAPNIDKSTLLSHPLLLTNEDRKKILKGFRRRWVKGQINNRYFREPVMLIDFQEWMIKAQGQEHDFSERLQKYSYSNDLGGLLEFAHDTYAHGNDFGGLVVNQQNNHTKGEIEVMLERCSRMLFVGIFTYMHIIPQVERLGYN